MGKNRYNWKSRQVVETVVDDTETKNIKLDLEVKGHYDQSNELVLPSKKRKTKIKVLTPKVTKILSKKHRKRLEKVVEKKKKKENRASLLEALCQVQATPEELNKLTSIASIQTKGLRRYFQEELNQEKKKISKNNSEVISGEVKINTIKGAKRKRLATIQNAKRFKNDDSNITGVEVSSSDSDSDSDSDEVEKETVNEKDSTKSENKEEVKIEDEKVENVTVTQGSEKEVEEIEIVAVEPAKEETVNKSGEKATESKLTKKERIHKPAVYVDVIRDEKIQKARLKLPILAEEQQIMETINENSVIILEGETGSGKTTQVPQFLYEAGYALKRQIAVTEPRRVAAIAMSKRVAEEMSLSSREVSYLIRFEGNVTDDTKIKFMTDGVLLKEVQNDFLLSKYSVVILDEAHERSVYTDILIGLLSRIVPLRHKRGDPLKLIIMSATLNMEDFTTNERLFMKVKKPPVLKVEARQYPVTVHFNKRTNENYLAESFNKVAKIHTKLPEGGILVFLTGQQEVNTLVRKLRKAFPMKNKNIPKTDENEEIDEQLKGALKKKKRKKIIVPKINLDDYSVPGDDEGSDPELSEEDSDDEIVVIKNAQPLWVLPLYSLLPTHKQSEIFKPPPLGCRLCVVSTNVAETSLTIPNIKYVVDSGKTKVKLYDKVTGVSSYVVTWTSKASANQRAGRAGRLGPGHCYRLYSSAVFNDEFKDFNVPEIKQKPVDDLYLLLKCMHIDKIMNFPFPTSPDLLQLKMAESRLEILGALKDSKVTPLGKVISKFPVLPRFGKMLALSHQQNLFPYMICLVAALSVQEVLLETPIMQSSQDEIKAIRLKWAALRKHWVGTGNSLLLGDNMVLLMAVGAAEYANYQGQLEKFCAENGLRHKAVVEVRKLRIQLTNEIKTYLPEANVVVDPKMRPPTDVQAKLLRQLLLSGMGDQVARKIPLDEVKDKAKYKYAYQANDMEEPVYLHTSSVLAKTLPEFVIYQEIYETNRMYMRGVTAIEPEWLPTYIPSLCNLSEPLSDPEPRYNPDDGKVYCTVTGTFGRQAWELPHVEIYHPQNVDYYKWFGRFLLEGKVFKKLGRYVETLLSKPTLMVKSWARLQPRTDAILKGLIMKEASTKEQLCKAWKEDPQYLLHEYLKWLPESAHGEVSLMWPPLDK